MAKNKSLKEILITKHKNNEKHKKYCKIGNFPKSEN